ncbi:helix-turn-helix domain-containing protein [Vibrio sp. CAU 1672]|uniref:helix-turn-helix domain-containing protein n=1 Tax=Vibrio sp. CAU 1672 TaxID=3032594 RepID=UPI0023D9C7B9|nr:helix-turn-helix domain-containing protein [Vibrio sp. CAU 1672]MDF2155303.1 helix-turn-helix domain-containing protein [Vibrio sp. CAU 1672]
MNTLLTPAQLAELLQVTEKTLANQRFQGRGIPFVKIEKAVRYRYTDVESYLALQSVATTRHSEAMDKE